MGKKSMPSKAYLEMVQRKKANGTWIERSQKHNKKSINLEATQSSDLTMTEANGLNQTMTFLHSNGNYDRAELVSQALAYAFLSDEERLQVDENRDKAIKSKSFF